MKLQDAYVAEKGTNVGNWQQIGYLMNNSSNFFYCDLGTCAAGNNANGYATEADVDGGYAATWTATNIATLNDCAANSSWSLATSQNGSSGGLVLYAATVTKGDDGDCDVLTPNFKKLNTKSGS